MNEYNQKYILFFITIFMKNFIFFSLLIFTFFGTTSQAQTQYITDEFDIMLRVAPSIGSKIIKPLPTGTPMSVTITNAGKAHSQVRTKDGLVGYVLTRFISKNQPAKLRVASLEKRLKSLQDNPDQLESKYLDLQSNYERLSQNLRGMVDNKEQAEEKYEKLKLASGSAALLSEKAIDLEKKVEQLVLQLDDMRIQNETLKDQSEKKSWMVGGFIALFGVLFGAILTGLNARKKRGW